MRRRYLLAFFFQFVAVFFSFAQHPGSESRRNSYYTLIYALNNDQARKLYQDMWDIDTTYCQRLFDLYPTDSTYRKDLPAGHYLFVKTEGGKLQYDLHSVNNLSMHVLTNHRDLMLVFYDSVGKALNDVPVSVRSRRIPFEPRVQAYRVSKSNRHGLVSVSYQGHVSYFTLNRQKNNTFFVRTGRRIIRTFPINHVLSPIFYTVQTIQHIGQGDRIAPPGIYYRVSRAFKPKPFSGYLVLHKPMYKPDDTVRLKGIVTSAKGKPYGKVVDVFLTTRYPDYLTKKIGTVMPYRRGAYQFEFVLADSLNLKLDRQYTIELRGKRDGRLLSTSFSYTAYQLKNNVYSVRADAADNHQPPVLWLKGVDTNEMPLFDAKADVCLSPVSVNDYAVRQVFVPDTLWFHQVKLDPIGETRVAIPDSVFRGLSLAYKATIVFYNTEHERTEKKLDLEYDAHYNPVTIMLDRDSISITRRDVADLPLGDVWLIRSQAQVRMPAEKITLPYTQRVDPTVETYDVKYVWQGTHHVASLALADQPDLLEVQSGRTSDSLHLRVENPRQLSFWYALFKNGRLVACAQAASLTVDKKAQLQDRYDLSIQYIWAGKSETREYNLNLDRRNLAIRLEHPDVVYPGQRATFQITVQDAKGKPVQDVDLTALAVTKKFETSQVLRVPSFQSRKLGRVPFNKFSVTEPSSSIEMSIDWAYWKQTLGLDSLLFYKFLFPEHGYYERRTPASVSQFTPIVVGSGSNVAIQVIYVDGQPVYYAGVSNREPYAFHITPGEHTIGLRLGLSFITIPKVAIQPREKLVFSIDQYHLPTGCTLTKMPSQFSEAELKKLSRYWMILSESSRTSSGYLQQGQVFRPFGGVYNSKQYVGSRYLVGPFYPGEMTYVRQDGVQYSFTYQPFSSYTFQKNLVMLRDVQMSTFLQHGFQWQREVPALDDSVTTLAGITQQWKHQEVASQITIPSGRFPDFEPQSTGVGRLTLTNHPRDAENLQIQATFLINLDFPDEYSVLTREVSQMPFNPGLYQAIAVLSNGYYVRMDSLVIKPYGSLYYNLESLKLYVPDTLSRQLMRLLKSWAAEGNHVRSNRQRSFQYIRELYYQGKTFAIQPAGGGHVVRGTVVSKTDGTPLPGVNVIVKGTTIGTTTDIHGAYTLSCPPNSTLVFSFIGLITHESPVHVQDRLDVRLQEDVAQLEEVVVVGYGTQQKATLTFSLAEKLEGRMAGVIYRTPRYRHDDDDNVMIRGLSTTTTTTEPLYILDGVVVLRTDINPRTITQTAVIPAAEAMGIYGSRAAGGVVLLTTRTGVTSDDLKRTLTQVPQLPALASVPGNTLRKNFRDYAFWKPALRTDKNGHAAFDVTFPDDLTGWNAYVLGVKHTLTGQTQSTIKSYKPLAAQLLQPLFLIAGDSADAVGKVTNYLPEELALERTIKVDQHTQSQAMLKVKNVHQDSIPLVALQQDTLQVFYGVSYQDYQDGELRALPVYPQGVRQATGHFIVLPHDTTLVLRFDRTSGDVKFYAQTDVLDVLMDEANYLKHYRYQCNEQQASKLSAWLLEKKISAHQHKRFKDEREVVRLIRALVANQRVDGSWSWWGSGEANIWVTLHVAQCLDLAQREGYPVAINREGLINYLEANLARTTHALKLRIQAYLLEQGEKLPVKTVTDSLMKSTTSSLQEKLMAQRLKQLSGEPVDWTWIQAQASYTMKGNPYWGETRKHVSDNAVQNTLLVYKMMEKEHANSTMLTKLRQYLLEQRQPRWRNTYESSQILQAILPRLLAEKTSTAKPVMQLSTMGQQNIVQFPFSKVIQGVDSVTISYAGDVPLYLSAHQEHWVSDPAASDAGFSITTHFEDYPNILRKGKPVKLIVEVEVKNDAEYVMIEVPIPAGCYYTTKEQSRDAGEVHREYDNHKTNIYCQYLKKGKYMYTISLLPRYTGSYTINPAVVSCMYVPTIYGRTGMKRINVDD